MARLIEGVVDNKPKKLLGEISTSGRPGPRGPIGPAGPPGEFFIPDNVLSIERLGDYLYKVSYNNIPAYIPSNNVAIGGCTSYVKNGLLYRNFDWNYSETASFWVKTKEFEGIASIDGLNDGELNTVQLGQLPYHISDGVNTDGIMVTEHVLFNDFDYHGSGDKSNPIQLFPYTVMTQLHNIADINDLQGWLDNISIPNALASQEYLLQFLVTDGTTTYYIGPSEEGYEIIDVTSNPKLANFKWVDKEVVERDDGDLQLRPTGVERWNDIAENASLEDLRFTKAYITPTRLSEFIGLRGTDKYSTDEELIPIYLEAQQAYLTRIRNGYTWQTVHSVVYGPNGIESLNTQENYNDNYVETAGVISFNSRQGSVIPQAGDYTSGMINSVDVEDYITNEEIRRLFNV